MVGVGLVTGQLEGCLHVMIVKFGLQTLAAQPWLKEPLPNGRNSSNTVPGWLLKTTVGNSRVPNNPVISEIFIF